MSQGLGVKNSCPRVCLWTYSRIGKAGMITKRDFSSCTPCEFLKEFVWFGNHTILLFDYRINLLCTLAMWSVFHVQFTWSWHTTSGVICKRSFSWRAERSEFLIELEVQSAESFSDVRRMQILVRFLKNTLCIYLFIYLDGCTEHKLIALT